MHNIHIGLELVERKPKIISQNFTFTTFHQSSSYEDFIEGIKPALEENENSEMLYSIQPGSFYDACDIAASISGYTSLQEAIETSKEEREEKKKRRKSLGSTARASQAEGAWEGLLYQACLEGGCLCTCRGPFAETQTCPSWQSVLS